MAVQRDTQPVNGGVRNPGPQPDHPGRERGHVLSEDDIGPRHRLYSPSATIAAAPWFARESVPQAEWSSPVFIKINRVLSAAWGVAIFAVGVSRVLAAAINGHTTRRPPETLPGLVVPVVIIIYMLRFSKSYPERVTHHEPAHASAGHSGG